jgi:hypothetical protein
MAATFNALATAALFAFIEGLGFTKTTIKTKDGHEVVYERRHHGDPQMLVLIYTSCSPDESTTVRKKGSDAIRVCLVCESDQVLSFQKAHNYTRQDGRLGLSSAKRIHRAGKTDAIFGRIRTRAQEMYRLANQLHKSRIEGHACSCGAPRYPDSGKCVLRGYCPHKEAA